MCRHRPFRELTKDFTPERRQRVEAKKAELRADMEKTEVSAFVVGTEERLKKDGFLETGGGLSLGKIYRLGKKPGVDDPRVKIVSIGDSLALKPDQRLKELIARFGKLKKGRDYIVEQSQGATSIIFTNDILRGGVVLAVVEIKESGVGG